MGTLVATLVVGPVADPASHLVHLAAPQAELTDKDAEVTITLKTVDSTERLKPVILKENSLKISTDESNSSQLVNFDSDDYHSAIAEAIQEAQKLAETGL